MGQTAESRFSTSIFKGFPEHIWAIADAGEDGLYSVHVKVNPNGTGKTFPDRVNLRTALDMLCDLQQICGLPDEALLISSNDAVENKPDVLNRRWKKVMEKEGYRTRTKRPSKLSVSAIEQARLSQDLSRDIASAVQELDVGRHKENQAGVDHGYIKQPTSNEAAFLHEIIQLFEQHSTGEIEHAIDKIKEDSNSQDAGELEKKSVDLDKLIIVCEEQGEHVAAEGLREFCEKIRAERILEKQNALTTANSEGAKA